MPTITIKPRTERTIPANSNVLQIVPQENTFLQIYIDSKRQGFQPDGTYRSNGLTPTGVVNLREETRHIMSYCNPQEASEAKQTTHLALGYVQSGKTMSFTALTALALDCKYKMVILLAGTKNNLLKQSRDRLEDELQGKNKEYRDNYLIYRNPTKALAEDIASHIKTGDDSIIVIAVLKNPSPLKKLNELILSPVIQGAMHKHTAIIIDDEADQASLNAYARKNSEVEDGKDQKQSSTYSSILKLRANLPGNSYIQYTATPQANLLINMTDFLSPKTYTLLTPGEGYVGGKKFFGRDKNNELFGGALIYQIPKEEVFDKKLNPQTKLPKSLVAALEFHILAVATKVYFEKDSKLGYLSMMLHIDQTRAWNNTFFEWVRKKIFYWREIWNRPEGEIDKHAFETELREVYPEVVKLYDEVEKPLFDELKPFIKSVLQGTEVHLMTSDADETDITWDSKCSHILVGAEMLNRGFTIEHLSTTYMPRMSKGAVNADTIEQRCRFFGYKMNYIKVCRVFLPEQAIIYYNDYISHEDELHKVLESSNSLTGVERTLMMSNKLRPTRSNVLPKDVMKFRLAKNSAFNAFESVDMIKRNLSLSKALREKHIGDFNYDTFKYDTDYRSHREAIISVEEALDFLDNFEVADLKDRIKLACSIRYLKMMSSVGANTQKAITHVSLLDMAWAAAPKERTLNVSATMTNTLSAPVFTGRSNSGDAHYYPGDDDCVNPELVTIQIHRIGFKAPISQPFGSTPEAVTIAIGFPQKLTVDYCTNIKNF